jgi:hypothetical protein
MKTQQQGVLRHPAVSLSKNLFFDRLTEVKGATKTSNTTPKCMWILERGVLRSKAKCLAKQVILQLISQNVNHSTERPTESNLSGTAFHSLHFAGWWLF